MEGSFYLSQMWVELLLAAELSLPKGSTTEWDFSRGARSEYLHAPLNCSPPPLQKLPCIAASLCPLGALTKAHAGLSLLCHSTEEKATSLWFGWG